MRRRGRLAGKDDVGGGAGLAGDHFDEVLDLQFGGAFLDSGELHVAGGVEVRFDGGFFFGAKRSESGLEFFNAGGVPGGSGDQAWMTPSSW